MSSERPILPSGPLTVYREKASFDWYDLKQWIEGPKLPVKKHIFEILAADKTLRIFVRIVATVVE